MDETRRAPADESAEGDVALGTIGFDWYLWQLGLARDSLKPARCPEVEEA